MLPKSDYLKILEHEPEVTFFYHDRPVLYTISHDGDNYLIALAEEDNDKLTDRFLLVQYPDEIFSLLQDGNISPREFFVHPGNSVHNVLVEYAQNDEPALALGKPYEDNATIPDEYLPTADARWFSKD